MNKSKNHHQPSPDIKRIYCNQPRINLNLSLLHFGCCRQKEIRGSNLNFSCASECAYLSVNNKYDLNLRGLPTRHTPSDPADMGRLPRSGSKQRRPSGDQVPKCETGSGGKNFSVAPWVGTNDFEWASHQHAPPQISPCTQKLASHVLHLLLLRDLFLLNTL